MSKVRYALMLGIIALSAPSTATLRGQDPGLGYGYLFGYGATNTPGIRSFVPAPPYFALHPPVYYGQRYMRPYGESPFASWPQLQPSASYRPRPAAEHAQLLINPYVPCSTPACAAAAPAAKTVAPVQPLVIDNPYFRAAEAGRLVSADELPDAPKVND